MTNREMIKNYNQMARVQMMEAAYYTRTKEKLFRGRMRITYGIKKNMGTILEKLKPYNEARDELFEEFRDLEKEKKILESAAPEEREAVSESLCVIKEGKERAEYEKRLNELLDIDVEDVYIRGITPEDLEGIELDSAELELLMFMIEE